MMEDESEDSLADTLSLRLMRPGGGGAFMEITALSDMAKGNVVLTE